MAFGDHLKVKKFGYSHHGIDSGDGTVIEFAGDKVKDVATSSIRVSSYAKFAHGGLGVDVVWHRGAGPVQTVRRASGLLGRKGYNLFDGNCEHVATWCATGVWESEQVENLYIAGKIIVGGLATFAAIAVLIEKAEESKKNEARAALGTKLPPKPPAPRKRSATGGQRTSSRSKKRP